MLFQSKTLPTCACPFGDFHGVTASDDHLQKVVETSHVLGTLDSARRWFKEMRLLRKLESKRFFFVFSHGHGDVVLKVHDDIPVKCSLTFLYIRQTSEKRGIRERAWTETRGLQR